MQIEEGKFYLGADGRKVGPIFKMDDFWVADHTVDFFHPLWQDDGRNAFFEEYKRPEFDLIAEWSDEEPDKLTIARIEFNGGIGNARVILSNGMELSGVIFVEAETSVDDIARAGLVVKVG